MSPFRPKSPPPTPHIGVALKEQVTQKKKAKFEQSFVSQ